MKRLVHPSLIAVAAAASAIAWPRLPQAMPVHWNLAGEPDRYGGRLEGALLIPGMMLLIWVLMRGLPKVDPRRANYEKMAGTYEHVITLVLVTMLVIHGAVLASALGYAVPIGQVIPVVVGVLLMGLGNVLPRARPNWWFGVRTPWTMSSDRVWTRTHRVAGYSMFVAGLGLVAAAFVPIRWAQWALIGGVAAGLVIPVAYSYYAWRQETATR
jgi:uncharacterized membrane protein